MEELSRQPNFLRVLRTIMRILVIAQSGLFILAVILEPASWAITLILVLAIILWLVLVVYLIAALVVDKGEHKNGRR